MDILRATAEIGALTKMGGGTAGYFGKLRGRGAPIKNNGVSNGAVSFLLPFQTTTDVITQGQARRGYFAAYLPVDHPDIEEYIDWKVLTLELSDDGVVRAVMLDDEAKEAVMPAMFANHLGDPAKRVAAEESSAGDRGAGGHSTFASQLMVNNIGVSIKAVALGLTYGLGTIVLLFYNGVILGLVAIDYVLAGQSVFLAAWLLPHGVIEIPAILIAGQCGLVLGKALIGHGDRAPLTARLRAIGPDLATLIGGVAVMLVWAGLVESFLSQYHQPVIPYAVKIAFGCVELAVLSWFLGSGRAKDGTPGAAEVRA